MAWKLVRKSLLLRTSRKVTNFPVIRQLLLSHLISVTHASQSVCRTPLNGANDAKWLARMEKKSLLTQRAQHKSVRLFDLKGILGR